MSSISFGSVGDIISVCLLAKQVVEMLDKTRGASAQYQGIIAEIRALEMSLLEVEVFARKHKDNSQISLVINKIYEQAYACGKIIKDFHEQLKKYETALQHQSTSSAVKKFSTKLKWQLSEKDFIPKFRAELVAHCNAINMTMITANVTLACLSHARNVEADTNHRFAIDGHRTALSQLSTAITTKINHAISQLDSLVKTFSFVGDMIRKSLSLNSLIYNELIDIRRTLPDNFDRALIQEPFILEDAIGRVAPVHLQFITSWEAFEAVLERRFHDLEAYEKIRRREFVLQEAATGAEIHRSGSWEGSVRAGQKVHMALVYERTRPWENDGAKKPNICPHCGTSSDAPLTADVHWYDTSNPLMDNVNALFSSGCSIVYRKLTEIVEAKPPEVEQIPRLWDNLPRFGESGFSKVIFGPLPLPKKRSREHTLEPEDFSEYRGLKRIRLVEKMEKLGAMAVYSEASKLSPSWAPPISARESPWEPNTTSATTTDSFISVKLISGATFLASQERCDIRGLETTGESSKLTASKNVFLDPWDPISTTPISSEPQLEYSMLKALSSRQWGFVDEFVYSKNIIYHPSDLEEETTALRPIREELVKCIDFREMNIEVKNWSNLLKKCYDEIRPGGWIELQDVSYLVGTVIKFQVQHPIARYWERIKEEWKCGNDQVDWVSERYTTDDFLACGFTNIEHRAINIPMSPGPTNGWCWEHALAYAIEGITRRGTTDPVSNTPQTAHMEHGKSYCMTFDLTFAQKPHN